MNVGVRDLSTRGMRVKFLRALHNGLAAIMLRVDMLLAIGMARGKLRDRHEQLNLQLCKCR